MTDWLLCVLFCDCINITMPLRFIDLFAGLCGFHLALAHLGCYCVFASEIKDDLRRLYQENFPGTLIQGDYSNCENSDAK